MTVPRGVLPHDYVAVGIENRMMMLPVRWRYAVSRIVLLGSTQGSNVYCRILMLNAVLYATRAHESAFYFYRISHRRCLKILSSERTSHLFSSASINLSWRFNTIPTRELLELVLVEFMKLSILLQPKRQNMRLARAVLLLFKISRLLQKSIGNRLNTC